MATRTLVIGIGSEHGDDRAGWTVVERLVESGVRGAEIKAAAAPADVIGWLDGVERLHVCDACHTAGPKGEVHRWKWPDLSETAILGRTSTHGLSLPEVLSLCDRLGLLPASVTIWGVEIGDVRAGCACDAAVERAADLVAQRIAQEVARA